MRFTEIICEDELESSMHVIDDHSKNIHKVVDYIKHRCQQYLNMINPKTDILYRGIDYQYKYNAIDINGNRKDRLPMDSPTELHHNVDSMLHDQGFIARRSNSWFGTGKKKTAMIYGKVYVAFPTDGFHYTWSNVVSDLFTYYQENRTKESIDSFVQRIGDSYEGDNVSLKRAIRSNHEIMFTSPRVILVKDEFYNQEIINYL